MLKKGDFAGF